jgi:hypothetical protein
MTERGWDSSDTLKSEIPSRNFVLELQLRARADRLNVLMRSYKEVPLWWYLALFVVSFVTIIVILAKGYFFIPGKHLL